MSTAAGLTPAEPVIAVVRQVRFDGVSGQLLTEAALLEVKVGLSKRGVDGAYTAVRTGEGLSSESIALKDLGTETGRLLTASAIQAVLNTVTGAYTERQFGAVRITVNQRDLAAIHPQSGTGVFTLRVLEGRVGAVGCQGVGSSPAVDPNDPLRRRVVEQSPVQVGDPLRLDAVQDFLSRLNRHGGRRVDVTLVPTERPGEMGLEYVVAEMKEPVFFAEMSNTGTKQSSPWRQQFGVMHYNLTRADDIFYANYSTDWFKSIHGVSAGYDRPLSKSGRWRGKVFGSWSQYETSDFNKTIGPNGLAHKFGGESHTIGGDVSWNFLQKGEFFLDAFTGIELNHVKAENKAAGVVGRSDFLLPKLGLRAQQRTPYSTFNAETEVQFNLPDLAGTPQEGLNSLDKLGRTNINRGWTMWRGSASQSVYLEPLLVPDWKTKPEKATLAHELFASVRGQWIMDDKRVPPSFLHTIGGFYSVRGYPESLNSGENAFLGTLEYRFHWPRSLKPSAEPVTLAGKPFHVRPPYPLGSPDWDLMLRGFCDVGWVKHNNLYQLSPSSKGEVNQLYYKETDGVLAGAGVGVELDIRSNLKLRADWGWALQSVNYNQEQISAGFSRLHISLSFTY